LDYIFLDKTKKTSIYRQIASSITAAIQDGRLKYNDKLPTEKEICEAFDISQTAVRMAYQTLIQENKIKRIKGKGTFVTNRDVYSVHFKDLYLFETWVQEERECNAKVLMLDSIKDDDAVNRILKLKSNSKCHLIHRLVLKNGNPLVYLKIYLPEGYFPNSLSEIGKWRGLFPMIEAEGGFPIKALHNTFSPIKASSTEAIILNIHPGEAIYWVRTLMMDEAQRSVAYVVGYFPGEFTEFEVTVHAKLEI